jgi:transcriptional regulator with XRE-family HTH domain
LKKSSKDLGISERISLIRSSFSLTAERLGEVAGVSGTAIANIEGGSSLNPGAEMLANISSKLGINLNWLILGEGPILKDEAAALMAQFAPKGLTFKPGHENDPFYSKPSKGSGVGKTNGPHIVALDPNGNTAAPIYNIKTAARYITGYDSQERPEQDGILSLPSWLLKSGDHAVFPVLGDSMEPTFFAEDYVLCRFIDRAEWSNLGRQTVCVVVSHSRGVQLKRVTVRASDTLVRCKSDNRQHRSFSLDFDDVLELWRFEWRLTANAENVTETVFSKVDALEDDVSDLRSLIEQLIDAKELNKL